MTEPSKLQSLTVFTTLNSMQNQESKYFQVYHHSQLLLYHSLEKVIADYVLKSSIANC
jgi:hypothetical protein